MPLYRLLVITASFSLSTGGLMAATPQDEGQFQLLTREEASSLAQKLSSVEGQERERLRQAEYARLKQKAEQAGYEMPVLAVPAATPQPAPTDAAIVEAADANAPEVASSAATAAAADVPAPAAAATETPTIHPVPNQAPTRTSPYSRSYQTARQSHNELVKSMEARRDALRKQMQKRRDEIARQRSALAGQDPGSSDARQLREQAQRSRQHQMEMAARHKKHQEEMLAYQQEREARRKAMEARINDSINAIGRPASPPYYPAPPWPPRPGYAPPYGPYAYPGR